MSKTAAAASCPLCPPVWRRLAVAAQVVLAGMLAVLDLHAAQAVGARRFDQLGAMFKQVRRQPAACRSAPRRSAPVLEQQCTERPREWLWAKHGGAALAAG